MGTVPLRFGIPDVELTCDAATRINPSSFAGHDLIVMFCPTDAEQAARELDAYRKRSGEFTDLDAWVLAFGDQCGQSELSRPGEPILIADTDRHAWVAFRDLARASETLDRADGATFLFPRGGGLHRYWHGSGHVLDVLEELQTPVTEHEHQKRKRTTCP